MEVVGSEIGQKMRSAIKAKLTELGCYVDDELPDYVMVMVANKRTRAQMEDDLQLFLSTNTELFVNWLHQVLKKLQEVTVTAPLIHLEKPDKSRTDVSSKSKSKPKKEKSKDKSKKSDSKKTKRKDKEKHHKKKEDKKDRKSKKKNKHEMIRPNVPPLLMNMEKESEPSITDVFAGQILKNHGINIDTLKEDIKLVETKPKVEELKINEPITVPTAINCPTTESTEDTAPVAIVESSQDNEQEIATDNTAESQPATEELHVIEAKIQGLRQKLVDQMEAISEDDEDFLNIRTEAEELMNDFADDVLQEIASTKPPGSTTPPPLQNNKESPITPTLPPKVPEAQSNVRSEETLPQIELQLPKRPLRSRLGAKDDSHKASETHEKNSHVKIVSPERFTPEREPIDKLRSKSSEKVVISVTKDSHKRKTVLEERLGKPEFGSRRASSKSLLLERRGAPASVVRVQPRPRLASGSTSNLLFRAMADAQRSLLNMPGKIESEPQIKHALVLPMRRQSDAPKIVIQVPSEQISSVTPSREVSDCEIDFDTESLQDLESEVDNKSSKVGDEFTNRDTEYIPAPLTRRLYNNATNYTPSRSSPSSKSDDTLDTITIHNTTVGKEKGPQFVVTLDGLDPNVFLAKKLRTEGLIDDDEDLKMKLSKNKKFPSKSEDKVERPTLDPNNGTSQPETIDKVRDGKKVTTAEDSTLVIVTMNNVSIPSQEPSSVKRKSIEETLGSSQIKRRRASPIIFDINKSDEKVKERTESVSSDGQPAASGSHKFDSVPSVLQPPQEKKPVMCRSFPSCRFGNSCAFFHPTCRFSSACSRRNCPYSHPSLPTVTSHNVSKSPSAVASHVVPAANYKTISSGGLPSICKFYPNCSNASCHFFHPKPCRYGKACTNKLVCNFYHHDIPTNSPHKWQKSKV